MDIIPFEQRHVVETAKLFCRTFRARGRPSLNAVAAHFRDVYLGNPWCNRDDPSLVCEADGRIAGFLGVVPFPLRLRGRAVRGAIGGNFMVDPAARSPFAGARLMKRFLEGRRDLSMTDTSNESGRKTWESYGGSTVQLYSLQWVRVLRPAAFALSVASRAKAVRPLTWLARPLAALADGVLAMPTRSPFRIPAPDAHSPASANRRAAATFANELEARELTPADLIAGIHSLSDVQSLIPDYSAESLAWLLEMAGRKREFGGRLIRKALFHGGAPVGWYLYYPNPGGWGQVLQAMARPPYMRPLLEHLFVDARRAGSTALVGRVHPLLMNDLPQLNCVFMNRKTWTQIHSHHEEVVTAINAGEALLTRLEGEWWTRFQNDAFDEPDPVPLSPVEPACTVRPHALPV